MLKTKKIKYEAYLSTKPPKTAKQYLFVFTKYIQSNRHPEDAIRQANLSDISKNNYLTVLKDWYVFNGQKDKADAIKLIKIKGSNKAVPSWYMWMNEILSWLEQQAKIDKLARAYYIMCRTGLRAEEILEDIDWETVQAAKLYTLKVITKGNKWKHIFLPKQEIGSLNELKTINYTSLNKYGKIIQTHFNLSEPFNPHQARYLYGNNLYKNYHLTKAEIMELLSHTDLKTTDIYLFDDFEKLQALNNMQYDDQIAAIEKLELKKQADAYKALYIATMKRLKATQAKLDDYIFAKPNAIMAGKIK